MLSPDSPVLLSGAENKSKCPGHDYCPVSTTNYLKEIYKHFEWKSLHISAEYLF